MNLRTTSVQVLDQLKDLILQIQPEDYSKQVPLLNASVSQHVRHILEFYICLFQGLDTGIINYDLRQRDERIERDTDFTLDLINQLQEKLLHKNNNQDLVLTLRYGYDSASDMMLNTNFEREIAYNIEHTIHHLAIIKPMITKNFQYIQLPDHFGIASSTVRHRNENH